MEPYLLLEIHGALGGRGALGKGGRCHPGGIRLLRELQGELHRSIDDALRLGLDVAGKRRRQARHLPTKDADKPLTRDLRPVLACDVWENAYYIDYRNARAQYLEAFWKLVNWDFAAANL
jgi:hypothetical protein